MSNPIVILNYKTLKNIQLHMNVHVESAELSMLDCLKHTHLAIVFTYVRNSISSSFWLSAWHGTSLIYFKVGIYFIDIPLCILVENCVNT